MNKLRGTNRCVFAEIKSQMFSKRKNRLKDKVKNLTTSDLLFNQYAILFIFIMTYAGAHMTMTKGPHFQPCSLNNTFKI